MLDGLSRSAAGDRDRARGKRALPVDSSTRLRLTTRNRMGILRSKRVVSPAILNRHPSIGHGKPDYMKEEN